MRLRDCFVELIAYVGYFLKNGTPDSMSFSQVQADINRLLSESENMMRQGGISPEDYDEARFAICAWIDEALLSSSWQGRTQWQRESLQRRYYQTADAGEEFFERLNRLGPHQQDVREIYYLCLVMGFRGRYHQKGDEPLLEQLMTSNLKYLLGSSVGLPSLDRVVLFPEGYPVETAHSAPSPRGALFTPGVLAVLVSPVILLGALFFIYSFILSNIGEKFLNAVS